MLVLRTEEFSSRKSSVLPISKFSRLVVLFLAVLVSSGLDSESAYGALCKSIDCQAFKGFARQLHNFSFKKKKKRTTFGLSKNPRTVRKRKILAGTSDRRTGEDDKTSELHCFLHSKVV